MNKDRQDPLFLARLAEQTERFEDMVKYVKEVVKDLKKTNKEANGRVEVSEEFRNLLSIAYKNVIGANRSTWRAVFSLEQKEKEKVVQFKAKKSKQLHVIVWYRKKIEQKLEENIKEVLGIISGLLQGLNEPPTRPKGAAQASGLDNDPVMSEIEAYIFYVKMMADYHRYMCEFGDEDRYEESSKKAGEMYEKAKGLAASYLKLCSPLRLGIELNMSVYYYETKRDTKTAFSIAKESYDGIEEQLQTLQTEAANNKGKAEEYNDAATIMQLLYENLNMWANELQEETQVEKGEY